VVAAQPRAAADCLDAGWIAPDRALRAQMDARAGRNLADRIRRPASTVATRGRRSITL
jgi:hypothetical protein